ncbi:MAG: hypothetical protein NVSMB66_6750 [Candidatus Doudnabacteria bacterium]
MITNPITKPITNKPATFMKNTTTKLLILTAALFLITAPIAKADKNDEGNSSDNIFQQPTQTTATPASTTTQQPTQTTATPADPTPVTPTPPASSPTAIIQPAAQATPAPAAPKEPVIATPAATTPIATTPIRQSNFRPRQNLTVITPQVSTAPLLVASNEFGVLLNQGRDSSYQYGFGINQQTTQRYYILALILVAFGTILLVTRNIFVPNPNNKF